MPATMTEAELRKELTLTLKKMREVRRTAADLDRRITVLETGRDADRTAVEDFLARTEQKGESHA